MNAGQTVFVVETDPPQVAQAPAQTRSIPGSIITGLIFLKTYILTPETMARAQELGKSVADILAEIYQFAAGRAEEWPGGERGLEQSAALHEAGALETFEQVLAAVKKA